MAVDVALSGGRNTIGEIVDYSVSEDATPLVAGDSSGSVGQIQVQAKANIRGRLIDRSANVVGDEITLTDTNSIDDTDVRGLGTISGVVSSADMPGERVNVIAETILSRLNADRVAKPFFGSYVPPSTVTTTRTNLNTNARRNTALTGIAKVQPTGVNALTRATAVDGYLDLPVARVTWTTAETAAGGGIAETTTGLGAGVSYTLSTYVRATRATPPTSDSAPVQRLRATLQYLNGSSVAVGAPVASDYIITNGDWLRVSVAGVAPTGTASAVLTVASVAGTNFATWKIGDTLDSTASLTEQGGLAEWFDGYSTNTDATDEAGVRRVVDYTWVGAAGTTPSVATVATTSPGYGYDATQGNYFRYLCELVGLVNVVVEDAFDHKPVAYPGWDGNVWKYMKDFAVATQSEIALVNGVVTMRAPRTREIPVESVEGPVLKVSAAGTAQYVEVYNYNSRWGTNESLWRSTTNYSIDANGYQSFEVTVPHFPTSVNNPIVVPEFALNYDAGVGQYRVIDSQGLIVDAKWWNDKGGRVFVSTVPEEPNRLKIELFGPQATGATYIGPFKFTSDDVNGIPALEVTGSGVFIDKKIMRIKTGVSEAQTSVISASAIDNVFLSNGDIAYGRGIDAACRAAGPNVTLTGTLSHLDDGFGFMAGSRIKYADNIFRITSVRASRKGISFTAENDMLFEDSTDLYAFTFADVDEMYSGLTFAQVDTIMAGLTFAEVDALFPSPTFASVDEIYEGLTFGEHAVYPYVKEPIHEEASAF